MHRPRKPASPFRYFKSSLEVIRLGDDVSPVWSSYERVGQSRETGGWPLSKQPVGEQPPALPTTRAGSGTIPTNESVAKARLYPCKRPQSLRSGTPSHRSPDLQGTTLSRLGRVAIRHGIAPCPQTPKYIDERAVRFRLTAPPFIPVRFKKWAKIHFIPQNRATHFPLLTLRVLSKAGKGHSRRNSAAITALWVGLVLPDHDGSTGLPRRR